MDGRLEPAVHLAHLRCVSRAARLGLRLDALDVIDEAAVSSHYLGAEVVDLARGHIWTGEDGPEDAIQVAELFVEGIEGAIDFATFFEDGIGVRAAA